MKSVKRFVARVLGAQDDAPQPIDADELVLFADNDYQLYKSKKVPIIKNMMRKRKAGKYDSKLAVKGFMYLAEDAARKYIKDVFGGKGKVQDLVPKKVREEAAKQWVKEFEAEADLGNYDDMV